jgi:uncharacterized protein (DUF885 family)
LGVFAFFIKKAQDALGNKFQLKEFHKVILDAGPSYFEVIETAVDAYINSYTKDTDLPAAA